MKITQSISYVLLGAFVLAPLSAFAQDTGTTNADVDVSIQTTTTAPVPTLYREGANKPVPPKATQLRPVEKVATGTRMLASSTRPLPVRIEQKIEQRETKLEERRADCVSATGVVSSTTDCIGAKMEQRQDAREERREEARERVQERRGDVLRALANLLITRLEAAIERETILADRIDSRIAKLKAKQVVTVEAEAKIVIARSKIAEAEVSVALATSKIQEAVSVADMASSTATRGDAGKYVRDEMNKAKQSLIEAHKALVDALNALKASTTTTASLSASTSAQ